MMGGPPTNLSGWHRHIGSAYAMKEHEGRNHAVGYDSHVRSGRMADAQYYWWKEKK